MNERILLIDDDANLLSGLRRQLRKDYDLHLALGGEQALESHAEHGPFAVVVSDMRMPGMDGVQVLREFKKRSPETVRLMLTGNADQRTAIDAVNQGSIFRFLSKPIDRETLVSALDAALEQYRLVTAEKELIEQTLAGSVKVLVEILTTVDAQAFGTARRLRDWAHAVGQHLSAPGQWAIDLAAMLSRIGWVTLPASLAVKLRTGERLPPSEQNIINALPQASSRLIANIPRLEPVARIILYQNKRFDGAGFPDDEVCGEDIPLGARILKVLNDVTVHCSTEQPPRAVFDRLEERSGYYDPIVFAAVRECLSAPAVPNGAQHFEARIMEVPVEELSPGHVLLSDIHYEDGGLVLSAGHRLSRMQLDRLANLRAAKPMRSPVRILTEL